MRKALITLLILTHGVCHAQPALELFTGGGLNFIATNLTDGLEQDDSVTFTGGELQLGFKYNGWAGIEVRTGASFGDAETFISPGVTATTTIDSYTSIYYRLESASEYSRTYLLIGQTTVDTESDFSDGTLTTGSESGLSFGAGIGFLLNSNLNLNIEAKQLLNVDDVRFNSIGLTLDYRFRFSDY